MKIITETISKGELEEIAKNQFGSLVKAVVDVGKGIMAVGGELHADEEALLLEHGSRQEDLWGVNFYLAKSGDDFVEFDSMINVRPSQGNRSRSVDNKELQARIREVMDKIIR